LNAPNKVQQLPDIIQKEDAVLFQKLALGDDEKNLLVNLLVLRHLMQTEVLADIIKTEVDVHATVVSVKFRTFYFGWVARRKVWVVF